MKRFLLADDNAALRSALRLMLETRLDAPLVFEAADHAALIDQSMAHAPECLISIGNCPALLNPITCRRCAICYLISRSS